MNPPQQPQQAYQPQHPVLHWPAQQQGVPQQHAPGERPPPPHVSSKPMWTSKLIFRVLSIIFNIILIGITAALGAIWSSMRYSTWDSGALIIIMPVAGFCIIWDIAESICILVRRGRRGIHPGAIVAIDLLLWLAFIVAAVFYALYYLSGGYYYYDSYYYGSYSDDSDSGSDFRRLMPMTRAVLAFASIQVAVHLLLFIFGCYETNARNKMGPIIIYPQMQPWPAAHPMSQYGPPPGQAIMLPAGQAPPAGYVAYAYGPEQPQPTHQQAHQSVSPETSTHGDPRVS